MARGLDRLTLGGSASPPRFALIPLLPLLFAACHVFADGDIPCTRDEMPCGEGDADADSDSDSDTDTDTDTDSDGDADPVLGAAYISRAGASTTLVVVTPELETALESRAPDAFDGPIAWRPADQVLVFANLQTVFTLASGNYNLVGDVDSEATDIAAGDDYFYISTANTLYRGSAAGGLERLNTGFVELDSIFWADAGQSMLYMVDRGGAGGSPTLYSYTPSNGMFVEELAGYDTTRNRSEDGFLGPGGQPFVCSQSGGAFAIADIAAGTTTPERLASGGLTDVFDCAYDPGSDELMVFSHSAGVLRVAAGGRTTGWEPADGAYIVSGEGW